MTAKSVSPSKVLCALATLVVIGGLVSWAQSNSRENPGQTGLSYRDVGDVTLNGEWEASTTGVSISASGRDIWDANDGFGWVYRPWDGDGEFVARITSIENTHEWAKAGIMLRENLDADAAHAMVSVSPEKGVVFLRRLTKGEITHDDSPHSMRMLEAGGSVRFQQRGFQPKGPRRVNDIKGAATDAGAPRWLKLVRRGEVIQAYDSEDGIEWFWLGTERMPMDRAVFVGVAVSSHDNGQRALAEFDNIEFSEPEDRNIPEPELGSGDGLVGRYYPGKDWNQEAFSRIDPQVDFEWGPEAPVSEIPADAFSVRWEGLLQPKFSEFHLLQLVSDDLARLWINGQLIIDEWSPHPKQTSSAYIELDATQQYLIRIDYLELRGDAVAQLYWSSPSLAKEIVPQTQLSSRILDSDSDGAPDHWERAFGLNEHLASDVRAAVEAGKGTSFLDHYKMGSEPFRDTRVVTIGGVEWNSRDIGQVGVPGDVKVIEDTVSIRASGHDIDAFFDGFHYFYRQVEGDIEVVARVDSLENTNGWAKAGVMIRTDLTASSPHVSMVVTPENGFQFLYREQSIADTHSESGDSFPSSGWVKLIKRGTVVSGYSSIDGLTWEWVGTLRFDSEEIFYAGVAATSHENSLAANVVISELATEEPNDNRAIGVHVGAGDGLLGVYQQGENLEVTRVDSQIDFDWKAGSPADGFAPNRFRVTWTGYLMAQQSSEHRIHLISDDGVRLWFNDKLLIDDWGYSSAEVATEELILENGMIYPIRVEYFESEGEAVAKLLWSGPDLEKQTIPQSQLFTTIPESLLSALAPREPDVPSVDSQNTGSVGNERFVTRRTDEGVEMGEFPDAVISGYEAITTILGRDAVTRLGMWGIEGDSIYNLDRRGYVEYEFEVDIAGMFLLECYASSRGSHWDNQYEIVASINGEDWEDYSFWGAEESTSLGGHTPWLSPGIHNVRYYFDNARRNKTVKIDKLTLSRVQGPDSNDNGIVDWVENVLVTRNSLENSSRFSLVSPACLEGEGRYVSMTDAYFDDVEHEVAHGAGDRWYVNVPLAQETPKQVSIYHENGGVMSEAMVAWRPTRLMTQRDLVIRQGDSLLLSYRVASARSEAEELQGYASIRIHSEADNESKITTVKSGESLPWLFDQPGDWTIFSESLSEDKRIERNSFKVRVLAGMRAAATASLWVGRTRQWEMPHEDSNAQLEVGAGIRMDVNRGPRMPAGFLRIYTDDPTTHYGVVRAGVQGPILGSIQFQGLKILASSESHLWLNKRHLDGTKDYGMDIVMSPLVPSVDIHLEAVVGGVTFLDGRLRKVVTGGEFNELGETSVYFSRGPGATTSTCHILRAFENHVSLGEY